MERLRVDRKVNSPPLHEVVERRFVAELLDDEDMARRQATSQTESSRRPSIAKRIEAQREAERNYVQAELDRIRGLGGLAT